MKVLVAGGAGFIGSHTVDLLIKEGYEVVIVEKLLKGKDNLNSKAKLYESDISDLEEIDKIFEQEKPNFVIHLAAQTDARLSIEDPALDKKTNFDGTKNIIDCCKKFNVKKIVFSSSAAVYGDTDVIPTPEDAPKEPISPYGQNKLKGEKLIEESGIPYLIFRYSNVYGSRQYHAGKGGMISLFINKLINDEDIIINGAGAQTRDFIYVKDVAKINVKSLKIEAIGIFNISSMEEISLNDTLTKLIKLIDSKSNILHGQKIDGEILRSCLNNTKAKEAGLINKLTALDEGLKETLEVMKK